MNIIRDRGKNFSRSCYSDLILVFFSFNWKKVDAFYNIVFSPCSYPDMTFFVIFS